MMIRTTPSSASSAVTTGGALRTCDGLDTTGSPIGVSGEIAVGKLLRWSLPGMSGTGLLGDVGVPPSLLGCLAGDAESAGDLCPGVSDAAQAGLTLLGRASSRWSDMFILRLMWRAGALTCPATRRDRGRGGSRSGVGVADRVATPKAPFIGSAAVVPGRKVAALGGSRCGESSCGRAR